MQRNGGLFSDSSKGGAGGGEARFTSARSITLWRCSGVSLDRSITALRSFLLRDGSFVFMGWSK